MQLTTVTGELGCLSLSFFFFFLNNSNQHPAPVLVQEKASEHNTIVFKIEHLIGYHFFYIVLKTINCGYCTTSSKKESYTLTQYNCIWYRLQCGSSAGSRSSITSTVSLRITSTQSPESTDGRCQTAECSAACISSPRLDMGRYYRLIVQSPQSHENHVTMCDSFILNVP